MTAFFSFYKSRRIRYLITGTVAFFLVFVSLRTIFYFGFSNLTQQDLVNAAALFEAIGLGLRFDIRLAILSMLPVAFLLFLTGKAFQRNIIKWIVRIYIGILIFGLLLIYAFDFGHYQYLGIRINATIFRFLDDADISFEMLLQSYPILKISLLIFFSTLLFTWLMVFVEWKTLDREKVSISSSSRAIGLSIFAYLIFIGIMGRATDINIESPVPIRWSDAYSSGSSELAALGLNPVVFLYETSRSRDDSYNPELVRNYYGVISNYLGIDQDKSKPEDAINIDLKFDRKVLAQPHRINADRPPNIVFIMLESLGASRVGGHGNPLSPTPILDEIGRNGWNLKNFYVPVSGTAKTVWASITGIPDASYGKSATRNPTISRQTLSLNTLSDYEKIYSIGGNAGWANMKAFINQSLAGVTIYEEGYWKSRNVDVWGISDLNLFKETDAILRSIPKDKPFFAYIQTAGNHEPFTIPKDSDGFVAVSEPEETLRKAGFRSSQQFNAVRLLDYSVGKFLELARDGGYFDNTIFVLFGDHNNRITTLPFLPPAYEQLNLESLHVPAYIYAPKYLKARDFIEATSLVDLVPTVLSLVGMEYTNTTMGRDILGPSAEGERAVPTLMREGTYPLIGAVTKRFFLQMNADGTQATLHEIKSTTPLENVADKHPKEFTRLSDLARGLHETSRYLMYANRAPTRQGGSTSQ